MITRPAHQDQTPVAAVPAGATAPAERELLATQLEWVLGFCGAWALCGIAAALVLRRRGHEFPPAAVLGAVFGPLFIPLACNAARGERPGRSALVLRPPSADGGLVDVLISAEALHDPATLSSLLDCRAAGAYRRFTIGTAIDYESARSGQLSRRAAAAARRLDLASMMVAPPPAPGCVLIGGPSPEALLQYGAEHGYDVVIVDPTRKVLVSARGPFGCARDGHRRG